MDNNQAQLQLIQSLIITEKDVTQEKLRHLRDYLVENPEKVLVVKKSKKRKL